MVGHKKRLFLVWFCKWNRLVIRIKEQDLSIFDTGKQHIMCYLIVKTHDNRAAPVQGVEKQAVVPDIDIRTAQIAAGHGKLSDIAAGLPLVNLCQMATFFKSGIVGCDPDAPDGLDPWIKL